MKIQRIAILAGIAAIASLFMGESVSWGQKPPPPANPQAPTINPLPTGIQRGKATDLLISGTLLASPTGASLGTPAKVAIPKEDKNGSDAGKFKVRIEVPADTPIGYYPFRIATLKGVSNLRVLCVDDLPQIAATGANRTRTTAQNIPVPCTVNGAVAAEAGDFYKFTAKAGQRLSFDCLARRVGSAIDAYIYLYNAKTGRELAYDNDSPGCQNDPRIVNYTFKEAGDYILEVKDVLNRGGAEYFYRIRIGDFPVATTALPMAAKRGTKAKIGFAGPGVDGVAPVDLAVSADPAAEVEWVAPKGASGLLGWPVPVMISDVEETLEKEPNDTPKEANRINVPAGVTGRFEKGGDTDCFVFSAKKGQKLAIEGTTLEYYS
ncbi:MAG TPA: PPC domain-containing protein, partial [Gemmataceae bacterium]|nr:PPC domain-containing protein [Gemmataceae bacterium]